MMVVTGMGTLALLRVLGGTAASPGHPGGDRKRPAEEGEDPWPKKVRFLSDIVSRSTPDIGNKSNTRAVGHEGHGDQAVPVEPLSSSATVGGPSASGAVQHISKHDKGKEAVVPEDPVMEAIRRAMAGGGPMISEGRQRAPVWETEAQVPSHLRMFIKPKDEVREKYPGRLGLHPDEPIG
ncbi:uncharacterized protein LOC125543685 isoform X1 [Triticum urartu]|uniref:uncharacterized protein LOC125543685 isoform X1 n=1 Tax=Triticum urartu TaxID=4572 RepID=UPI002042C965|nr:uncharacterized protein LOC125543685 isoform X1 [Triticum urartu]